MMMGQYHLTDKRDYLVGLVLVPDLGLGVGLGSGLELGGSVSECIELKQCFHLEALFVY